MTQKTWEGALIKMRQGEEKIVNGHYVRCVRKGQPWGSPGRIDDQLWIVDVWGRAVVGLDAAAKAVNRPGSRKKVCP